MLLLVITITNSISLHRWLHVVQHCVSNCIHSHIRLRGNAGNGGYSLEMAAFSDNLCMSFLEIIVVMWSCSVYWGIFLQLMAGLYYLLRSLFLGNGVSKVIWLCFLHGKVTIGWMKILIGRWWGEGRSRRFDYLFFSLLLQRNLTIYEDIKILLLILEFVLFWFFLLIFKEVSLFYCFFLIMLLLWNRYL